jgi:hypothetical protein
MPAVAAVILLGLCALGFGAAARAAVYVPPEPTHAIDANVNDPAIDASRGQNFVWLGPAGHRVGRLMVFMPSGGPTNLPKDWREMGSVAAGLGYHVIVLAYQNEAPIAANPPAGCGNSVEPPASPPNCAIDARMEMLDGNGESSVVSVSRANSIENRLAKVLDYLAATYPAEGWGQFIDAGGGPKWQDTVVAGASLGAGQAVLVSMLHTVYRVSAFHGWTDAKHGWVHLGLTPSNRYFTLIHERDNFFARTCFAYVALGLAQTCPLPGFLAPPQPLDPLLVENRTPPFGTPQLVFDLEPFTLAGVADPYHSSTTRDGWIAREADGNPNHFLVNAWRAVLGDSDADTFLDEVDNCKLVANPAQTDDDADGVGDACDLHVSTPSEQLAGLEGTIDGFGLDTGLSAQLHERIDDALRAVDDGRSPCDQLDHVVKTAIDKAGRHTGGLGFGQAVQILDTTNRVGRLLGCAAAVPGAAAAEDGLVGLLGTIDAMGLSKGESNSLAGKVRDAAGDVLAGPLTTACDALGGLDADLAADAGRKNKLTGAQAATLTAAVDAIRGGLAC